MKGTLTLVTPLDRGGSAAARMVDGRLDDLLVDPPPGEARPRPGAIYRAILGRPMKGLGGAIVELGGGQTGFLRDTRGLAPGRPVLVQIAGWAEPQKAPPVTRRLLLKGRLAIVTPGAPGRNLARSLPPGGRERLEAVAAAAMADAPETLGLIVRSRAATADGSEITAEIAALRAEAVRLEAAATGGPPALLLPAPSAAEEASREWPDPEPGGLVASRRAFDEHGVWEAIDRLLCPLAELPGGGQIAIEPTRALVAVDVNTGGDTTPAAALKANLAAARILPTELRLRGLGGQIVIDFAPMPKKDRPRVADAVKAALARDPVPTTVTGWTALGHLELVRQRTRRPLTELMPLRP